MSEKKLTSDEINYAYTLGRACKEHRDESSFLLGLNDRQIAVFYRIRKAAFVDGAYWGHQRFQEPLDDCQ